MIETGLLYEFPDFSKIKHILLLSSSFFCARCKRFSDQNEFRFPDAAGRIDCSKNRSFIRPFYRIKSSLKNRSISDLGRQSHDINDKI